jgi:hypothetical protein
VAAEELPDPDRHALLDLLRASGLLEAASAPSTPTPVPDVLRYRLSITAEGRTRTFAFNDVMAPPAARPLLQHLQERAVAGRAGPSSHPELSEESDR